MKYLILLAILASGCGGKLRPDASLAAIDSNYDTAEICIDGSVYLGNAVVGVKDAWPKVEVQGYYKGEVRVDSKDCEIHETIPYDNNQLVSIALQGAPKTCLISVLVSPEYPPQPSQDIVVRGFHGNIALRATSTDWVGLTRKVTGKFHSSFKTWVGGSGSVRAVVGGCGVSLDQSVALNQGYFEMNLEDVVKNNEPALCILEGVIISPEYEDLQFTAMVDIYDSAFVPVSRPLTSFEGDTLVVDADNAVSVVSLDDQYTLDTKAKFKGFMTKNTHILRVLTVKGRSAIGFWNTKDWLWIGQ